MEETGNVLFSIPIRIYNTNLLVTMLTEYLTTLNGRCHLVQNTMTVPWHHEKLRRFTNELRKENRTRHEKRSKEHYTLSQTRSKVKSVCE